MNWSYAQLIKSRVAPEEVGWHHGAASDFLQRYRRCALDATRSGRSHVQALLPRLAEWIADERNLHVAWQHLACKGGGGSGPDGITFDYYSRDRVWEQLRALRQSLRAGDYRPGDERTVLISKGPGRGTRTLRIRNIRDRVVERAVMQIVQPLLDARFHRNSFGGRPGLGCWDALARALALAEADQRLIWIADDIRDAFTQVPLQRLMDVVRQRLPDQALIQLIARIVEGKNGLRQGSPLSTLLMNLYLDHFLDRPWSKQHPTIPLLRFIDDLLVLCTPDDAPVNLYEDLQRRLLSAGMPLKGNPQASIIDLPAGQTARWLGFDISRLPKGMTIQLPHGDEPSSEAWAGKLTEILLRVHERPDAPLRATQVILGFAGAIGPAFSHANHRHVYEKVIAVANVAGFEEIPSFFEFRRRWRQADRRWQDTLRSAHRAIDRAAQEPNRSQRHAVSCRMASWVDRAIASGEPLELTIYTDGCCLRPGRWGGWAFQIKDGNELLIRQAGALRRTTSNRAELWAIIRALTWLPAPARIRLVSDSRYALDGIAKYLALWESQNWRAGSGNRARALANRDLWMQIAELSAPHLMKCEWVRAHAGHRENEECDRMARRSAERIAWRRPELRWS